PRTSPRFRVRSTPLTISCHDSSLKPSILRPLMSRSTSPLVRVFFSVLIAKSARLVQKPVDDKIDGNGEERDGASRKKRGRVAVRDERLVLSHHRAPIGRRRLDAD